jgi:hypothetical protein
MRENADKIETIIHEHQLFKNARITLALKQLNIDQKNLLIAYV